METTLEITNQCSCTQCDECGLIAHNYGEPCEEYPDCSGTQKEIDECFEDFEEDINYLESQVEKWIENHSSNCGYILKGSDMGWRRQNAYNIYPQDYDGKGIVDTISVNSAWNQTWTINDKECLCVQSHHDAPTGELYMLYPVIGCLYENDEFLYDDFPYDYEP